MVGNIVDSVVSDDRVTVPENELRRRLPDQPAHPQKAESADAAKQAVIDLNAAEYGKDKKVKRTFGRTPGGTVFTVPTTHDMVSQLFSPFEPKNLSDGLVVTLLTLKVVAVITLPRVVTVPLFAVLFLFWRAMYNGGIGWLLHEQSNHSTLVQWAKRTGIFEKPDSGRNKHPQFYNILKRELETKIPKDYKFEEAPLEYNTWLLFRRFVDLVLMSDFTSYCCFAIACGTTPEGEHLLMTITRWAIGIGLVLFNLWVKLDAHRVVKDFAWYWGDFFFLIDQELTFDGVFEMAPHPMYSVGYAGFYGISLMAASYRVLAISIIGHVAQFAFLAFVESPHIEKTYNPPTPRKRLADEGAASLADSVDDLTALDGSITASGPSKASVTSGHPPFLRDIVGLKNLDMHRIVDVASILLQLYFYIFALMTPSTPGFQAFFFLNAVFWRLWYSIGLGYILTQQSSRKTWTRHFIKWGETSEEAWRQWKGTYHLSMVLCYVSFVTAAWKMYYLPADWQIGFVALRHVLGFAMIALQLWTFFSIYDSLGEFGWFFGDFFYDNGPKLTYGGIYRFLNNPERVLGLAGVWGFALITWSRAIFFLAVLSHVLTLGFIQYVERPHMQKRYGQSIRQSSGVSTTFQKSLPKSLRKGLGSVDRALDDTLDILEDLIDAARPKLAAGMETFVKDTRTLFRQYPARISITRLADDMEDCDSRDYSVAVVGGRAPDLLSGTGSEKMTAREGLLARQPSFRGAELQPVVIDYGQPIKVNWTAPANHSNKDWVGLYMLADVSSSREITRISSQGRWVATTKGGGFDNDRAEHGILVSEAPFTPRSSDASKSNKQFVRGEMVFAGDKLWWTEGVFELRLHHAGKHNVLATSAPFEIRVPKFDDNELFASASVVANSELARAAVEQALLPLVRNCFDNDEEIAPNTVEEHFGGMVEREGKFARRVVYAVQRMFGLELAPSVVKADGCVRNLGWRLVEGKIALAPYSMSSNSRGTSTPDEQEK